MIPGPSRRLVLRSAATSAALLAAGCAGVPLRTLVTLRTLGPADFLAADPSAFRIAFELDARVPASVERPPAIDVLLTPDGPGAAPRAWALALVSDRADAAGPALPAAPPGRRWLVWRLSEPGVADMIALQRELTAMRARGSRGTLAVTVRRDWVAEAEPAVVGTRLQARARLTAAGEFIELWSGRVPDVPRGV
jgi:hypothetical protein